MHDAGLALSFIPEGLAPARFLILGSLSVMVVAAAKAGLPGVSLLSVPLMAYACGSRGRLAIGTMLPLLIACDYVVAALWWRRHAWDWRNIRLLLPGMLVGVAVGWLTLCLFDRLGPGGAGKTAADAAVTLAIGLIAVGFVVLQLLRSWLGRAKPLLPTLRHGLAAGSAAGFTSTLAHAAGPVTTMYLLPQRMPKSRFVATAIMYYWIGNQVKLIPYYERGLLTVKSLLAGVWLTPAILVGAAVGYLLHQRINERLFRIIVNVLLAAAGVDLSIRSVVKLLN